MFFLKSVLRITILLILILFPTEVESSTLFSPSSTWETEGQIRSLNSSVLSSHSSPLCMLSHFSPVWLFATLWTVAHQALLSMGFSRQEYWSGFPCPPPGDIPNPGIKPGSSALQGDSLLWSSQMDERWRHSSWVNPAFFKRHIYEFNSATLIASSKYF